MVKPQLVSALSSIANVSCGSEHSMALNRSGELFSWGQGEGGLLGHGNFDSLWSPKRIEALRKTKIVQLECGGLHTLAVNKDGHVFSWRRSEAGQLGMTQDTMEKLSNTDLGIPFPRRVYSQLGDKFVKQVAAGDAHSLALTDKGVVYGWGWSNYGQLGLGFSADSFEPGTGNNQSKVLEPTEIKELSRV